MQITIQFSTDSASFEEGDAGREVARILRKLADATEDWPGRNAFSLAVFDLNGNKVGRLEASQPTRANAD